jgi:DnaJ-class molecular chaperone
MDFSEFYKELDLPNNASEDEVKKAYKKSAIKYHPDKNPDNKEEAEAKFKKISEAYQALSDKDKYMRENMGSSPRRSGMHPGFIDPNELFKQFFNMDNGSPFNIPGMNVRVAGMAVPSGIGSVMRSSNIRFENGKKIETITEVINGVQRQQTIVTDGSPNQGGINIGFRMGGGTNMHHILFR